MLADLGFTTNASSSYYYFFLFRQLYPRSWLIGTQPKPVTCSELSTISKCTSEIWGILSRYKSGAPTQPFSTTSQLNGNFNGIYLRIEDNRASASTTREGLLHCLKMSLTLVDKRLQIGPPFYPLYPPCINSAFYFISSLRSNRRRKSANLNSTKLCQTVDSTSRRKLGIVPPEKNWFG